MTFPMPLVAPFHEAGAPASIEFVQSTTYSAVATATYSTSMSIGAAAPGRVVFVAVAWTSGSPQATISSATIGGVAATVHVSQTGAPYGTYYMGSAILSAVVPTGTTATVSVTFSRTGVAYAQCATFRALNLLSTTPVDTDAGFATAYQRTLALDVSEGGVLLAATHFYANTTSVWGGVTGRYVVFADSLSAQGACSDISADATGKVLTMTRADGNGALTTWGPAVAASFR